MNSTQLLCSLCRSFTVLTNMSPREQGFQLLACLPTTGRSSAASAPSTNYKPLNTHYANHLGGFVCDHALEALIMLLVACLRAALLHEAPSGPTRLRSPRTYRSPWLEAVVGSRDAPAKAHSHACDLVRNLCDGPTRSSLAVPLKRTEAFPLVCSWASGAGTHSAPARAETVRPICGKC